MRIFGVDELPFHQHPAPFHMAATSDPRFNDGYFLAFYALGWYLFAGLRLHPNANVIDGWASVAHAGRQRAVRASRTLRPGYDDLAVGPVGLAIETPLEAVRLTVADNPSDIRCNVELRTQAPPFVENRYQHLRHGAVVNDVVRYTTVCRAHGRATVAGEELDVDGWHALRDHSWGVRAAMGPPSRVAGRDEDDPDAEEPWAWRLWMPFEVDDHSGFVNVHEARDGRPISVEGRLDFRDGSSRAVTRISHDLVYEPGTTRPTRGAIGLTTDDGVERTYWLEAAGTPADVQAGGYYRGWADGGGPGIARGDVEEYDDYDASPGPERSGPPHVPAARRLGPTEFPMIMVGPGGAPGMAHLEHSIREVGPGRPATR